MVCAANSTLPAAGAEAGVCAAARTTMTMATAAAERNPKTGDGICSSCEYGPNYIALCEARRTWPRLTSVPELMHDARHARVAQCRRDDRVVGRGADRAAAHVRSAHCWRRRHSGCRRIRRPDLRTPRSTLPRAY